MQRNLLIAGLLLIPVAGSAQARGAARPAPTMDAPITRDVRVHGWIIRPDRDNTDMTMLSFNEMKPGWHIVTGPVAAVFYRPEDVATGPWTATLKMFFFGQPGQHLEGYGMFVGGKNLESPKQSYLYFLARNDGQFLIKERAGTTTKNVQEWTRSPAIKTITGEGDVPNVLRIQAGRDSVKFLINDVVVATRPRSAVAVDGQIGLRINHFISAHVTELKVEKGK